MSDLLLKNVRLPTGEAADIRVLGGRIEAIGPELAGPDGMPRLDGRGRLVLPGGVDMHVHFRTPGAEHKETLLTGARAAVKGGVTTCADMPNTSPPTTTVARLEDKIARAAGAPARLLFNFGTEPGNLAEVREAAKFDCVRAIKIYLGPSTGVGGLAGEAVEAHFRQAAELDLPVMVHAEDVDLITRNAEALPHEMRNHGEIRSLEAELSAVKHALALAGRYPVRLYLAHVTSARVLDLAEASGFRERIFVEACPHHLILSTRDVAGPLENRFKVNPPLRPPEEQAALFAALETRIDGLGSDHAPHTLEEKQAPYDEAPSGLPGVEYLLPLALTWWRQGKIGPLRLLELTSANAARWFGLNGGALAPGRDADLVLVDPDREWTAGEGGDRIASKCGWSPYAGMALVGRPEVAVVDGTVVHQHLD